MLIAEIHSAAHVAEEEKSISWHTKPNRTVLGSCSAIARSRSIWNLCKRSRCVASTFITYVNNVSNVNSLLFCLHLVESTLIQTKIGVWWLHDRSLLLSMSAHLQSTSSWKVSSSVQLAVPLCRSLCVGSIELPQDLPLLDTSILMSTKYH